DLRVDVGCGVDEHLLDRQAFDVHAQDARSVLFGLIGRAGELDASRLAAPADEHLRLHDGWPADLLRDLKGFFRCGCDLSTRNRYAELGKPELGLIFVELHVDSSWLNRLEGTTELIA